MDSKEIKDKNQWNSFLLCNDAHLLQSWQWGQFQEQCGRPVWRLAVGDNAKILAVTQVIKYELPLGKSYLYCPRGPVVGDSQITSPRSLFEKIKKIAKQEKAIFLRVDPEVEEKSELAKFLREMDFNMAEKQVQPKDTLFLDLTKSEEDLLADMHHKARYNIRLAGRKGVVIRRSTNTTDVNKFYTLMEVTTERDKFSAHPPEYYQKQIEILGRDNLLRLFLAERKGEIIAAAIVSFFGDKATYLHGASSHKHRRLMAPHLLQWEAVKEAKKRGMRLYDFGGIAPSDADNNHPWSGITRFKRGFGGEEKNWVGAMELVYQPVWYRGYNLLKKFR
ncbi:peptidoglycan bridge formation glycyltransferase FemA/FemB family protein [Patescibacteria group bacterium]|nr:peptidoglycan bridge formation glycyltransferase FemA/FemB family protein [Patescibacteria group bacterium]